MGESEFFDAAATYRFEQLELKSTTDRIDSALDLIEPDDSASIAVAAGRPLLMAGDDEW